MKHSFLITALALFFLSLTANSQTNNNTIFNQDSLRKEISVLAADSFLGRKPFTAGETKTIDYLKNKFQSIGLEPGNGMSYFQDVPMVNIVTEAAPTMQVQSPQGSFELKGFDDYAIWTDQDDKPVITLDKNELVFAGYGVVAPEYNWNDYAGLDVKGKVVMVLVNDPGFGVDSTLFKGDTMTYYGRWTYKFEEAARQGAKGCLIVHNTKAASYPFSVVQNSWNTARLHLDTRGKNIPYCDVIGWITGDAAKRLLNAAGKDTTLLAQANQRGFKPVPLNEQLSTSIKVTATYKQSHNVIAKITGSKYPDEYIIYTAHWDHLGIGTPDERGDSIYNGALDNASGTAGLLEIVRAYKNLQPKPARTVVFLAVTAEEQGLWGSAYYAQNPVYPLAQTVASINMDVLNSIGKTADITVTGAGQNELEDVLKEVAQKSSRYISFDTHPEAGYYYRSDHFNFAKVGVPALDAGAGTDVIGKGKAYGEQMGEAYTNLHYHRPSDEYNANMNLEGAIADLKLLFEVGKQLAFSHTWPQWKTGSEFKAMRDKTAGMRK
ncbi:M20/M25/M40 family metallo-hydrolase [Ilyomonas limi]|uniref:M20/M25/M40 family metallo-hydrolase n=1 Tax=Ilyomonas limi TaxID=2575867 RepID=A0A4U3L9B1_9BACT|nr:M28 family metallopeptidase [Ilyomonas limi]TKK71911.1 M20/M25/M40 family metallo-hydrolase [Ilyomonas limi]